MTGGNHCAFNHLSRIRRKSSFCICEKKDADQLQGDRAADQHLCFHSSKDRLSHYAAHVILNSLIFMRPIFILTKSEYLQSSSMMVYCIHFVFIGSDYLQIKLTPIFL